jgi:hypothetical protein
VSAFDAAIKVLHEALKTAVIDIPCPICQIESAIRVLTAAGKVDKERALAHLAGPHHYEFYNNRGEVILKMWMLAENTSLYQQILTLLSALPDPATEAKQ